MSLIACQRCHRHVRHGEACPFCLARGAGRIIVVGLVSMSAVNCADYGAAPPLRDAAVEDARVVAEGPCTGCQPTLVATAPPQPAETPEEK